MLIKKILMVLVVYLVLLVSINAMGGLSSVIHGEGHTDGNARSYKNISSFPVVIE